jgi:hypothetical protein
MGFKPLVQAKEHVLKQDKNPTIIKIKTKSNKTKNLRNYGNIRKKAMNFAYGMGAAVVIVGAL